MDVRAGYKLTEVGVIPKDWEVRSIGQMFRLVNGCAFKPEDWKQNGTPIIRIQNLNDPSAPFNYSQAPVPEKNRVEAGDLLFAWSGTLGTSFGARVWTGPSGVLNQHIFRVLMDEQRITLAFSQLVFARIEEDIAKQAHGFKTSFVHVKKSDLVKVSLPLPPIAEQRAIATAVGDVDALLCSLERLIDKKNDIKQAAVQQLLPGQTRLPGFHGEWEVRTLPEVAWFQEGPGLRNWQFTGSGMKVINVTNLEDGVLNLDRTDRHISVSEFNRMYQHFAVDAGDIVMASSGNSYSKIAAVRDRDLPLVMNTSVIRFKPAKTCDYGFLWAFLSSPQFKTQIDLMITGGAQPNFGPYHLKRINIPIPLLPEQTAIAAVLTDIDAELAALEQRLAKTRDLKQGMMQELLTGRTRLV